MAFSKIVVAACSLATIANGHMLMATPARVTSPAATNGPLEADGSNFPCQMTSSDTTLSGESTSMALGSDQPLEFIGQSVHGGGSCQVSITYDESPTSSSTWKVITSIEGGCPARNTAGNLGDDTSATAADPYSYNFTLPDDIPTGNAVLAWTWFNKVGNREMYMNCAKVELTGTSGDQSNYDSLPDMFTANIDSGGCQTIADTDLEFPDPGDVVQKLNGATTSWGGVTGTACSATAAATTAAAGTTTAAAETTGIFASVSVSVGVGAGAAQATTTAAAAAAATTTATSSSSSDTSSSSTSSSSSSSGSETAGSSCDDEGDYVCVDSTSYLVCASGLWTSMPVATGTECSGSGNTFAIVASSAKMTRALRWVKRGLPFLG